MEVSALNQNPTDNIVWDKSNLHKGDRIKIQETLLITGDPKNFLRAEYVDETKYGIRLRFFFKPGPCTEEPKWWYDYFVSWPSIYCGDVRLQTEDGESIHAKKLNDWCVIK